MTLIAGKSYVYDNQHHFNNIIFMKKYLSTDPSWDISIDNEVNTNIYEVIDYESDKLLILKLIEGISGKTYQTIINKLLFTEFSIELEDNDSVVSHSNCRITEIKLVISKELNDIYCIGDWFIIVKYNS